MKRCGGGVARPGVRGWVGEDEGRPRLARPGPGQGGAGGARPAVGRPIPAQAGGRHENDGRRSPARERRGGGGGATPTPTRRQVSQPRADGQLAPGPQVARPDGGPPIKQQGASGRAEPFPAAHARPQAALRAGARHHQRDVAQPPRPQGRRARLHQGKGRPVRVDGEQGAATSGRRVGGRGRGGQRGGAARGAGRGWAGGRPRGRRENQDVRPPQGLHLQRGGDGGRPAHRRGQGVHRFRWVGGGDKGRRGRGGGGEIDNTLGAAAPSPSGSRLGFDHPSRPARGGARGVGGGHQAAARQ